MSLTDPDEAPGRLDLVRRFVNTLSLPDGPDRLSTPEAASAWCRDAGLPPVANQEDCDRLRAFREALRDALFANNGEFDAAQAWKELEPFAQGVSVTVAIEGNAPVLRPAGGGAGATIGALLAIVYDAFSSGTWSRLRACRKSSCRYAYYDRSKNASRAWCSMTTCGNQEKANRRRQRERR
ncbi:MAG TPA: CGNR zinc finger domain-containing protein [Candidatus Baltobacteraceae bacterium]|nr:CGNR zinc finger domain-containing protein [Candidatus Baltobacteraceae bacterium]